jgi:flavin-dependent dehydrogenase
MAGGPMLPRSTDVFVIGGGPAGLAAAIAARQRGFDVTLADAAVPPIDKACGEGIMPDGIAAARSLGLEWNADAGHPFRGIRFCDPVASVHADFPTGHALGVRRIELHRIMVEHAMACGVRLSWGTRIAGISSHGVQVGDRMIRARWIVGADGSHSPVRRWTGLDASHHEGRRYGFRRHYRVAQGGEYMEVHWGERCQLYLTPVGPNELCVALISRDHRLRLRDALATFPVVAARLADAEPVNLERGGVTVSRRLKAVARGNVALVGDASGSVDAVTGEGLCLLFQQSLALADAMTAGDLSQYQRAHQRIGRRPEMMSELMLLLDRSRRLRGRTIRAMAADPRLFARLIAMHVGELPISGCLTNGLALGWRMLSL